MIETIRLRGGITFHACRDSRFKQGCMSIQFMLPLCREDAAKNALVPAVLLRGSRQYPDIRAITNGLDSLYGSGVGALARKYRSSYGTGFYLNFLEDRFAFDGGGVLLPLLDMTEDLLLCPADGSLRRDFVEGEKQNLVAAIESRKNNKAAYAMEQLVTRMCRLDPSGTPRLGTAEDAAAITREDAQAHYERLLVTAPITVFYVGSQDPEPVARRVEKIFSGIRRDVITLPQPAPFRDGGGSRTTQKQKLAQSQLCMGFLTPITLEHPLYPAAQLLNILYGSGMTSKLFLNVREKKSLCYSIHSVYTAGNGVLTVGAGIDAGAREEAENEILRQLEDCRKGRISGQEIAAARETFRSTLTSVMDSPSALEGYLSSALHNGVCLDTEERLRQAENVTVDMLCEAAKSIEEHSVFFLEGEHS